MLKRHNRLRSRRWIRNTMNHQRLFSHRYFTVFYMPPWAPNTAAPQFAFVVSKKVHKRAVRRNKIRRRLREIIRTQILPQYEAHLPPGSKWVVLVRQGALEATYQELAHQLSRGIEQAVAANRLANPFEHLEHRDHPEHPNDSSMAQPGAPS